MSEPKTHVGKVTAGLGTSTLEALRTKSWIYPLVAAALVAVVGVISLRTLERELTYDLKDDLQTIVDSQVTALRIWLQAHEQTAEQTGRDPHVATLVEEILRVGGEGSREEVAARIRKAPALGTLREYLAPILGSKGYTGFIVLDESGCVIAAHLDAVMGVCAGRKEDGYLDRLLEGETVITRPFLYGSNVPKIEGEPGEGDATMFVGVPLAVGERKLSLGFRIPPEEFTRIFAVGRFGKTGETYAFDQGGLMISESRFDKELRAAGLISDEDGSRSALTVQIRDPGGDVMRGYRPDVPLKARPLTRMAAAATEGKPGVDVEGSTDYRGVPVVGAWTRLDDYGFGIVTQIDLSEAYKHLYMLRRAFWGLFGLLVIAALAIFGYSRHSLRLRFQVAEAQKIGQYTLVKKIGEGGMGEVYRSSHALLRRPTAVKILRPDVATAERIARFEREVQLTSQLAHPNTIAIYDYGRTSEGVFYYAMEYLPGFSLDQLVKRWGAQPEGRVVTILKQACGSLAEAHAAALIHRDIKPANLMLCDRGGIPDMVKVLDFGLVRGIGPEDSTALTQVGNLTGTPLYMSPEAIRSPDSVDARSDIYALGAVGYFMLAGTHVFDGDSVVEVCAKQVTETPVAVEERLGRPVNADLEAVILRCLAKKPKERPQGVRELLFLLESLEGIAPWTSNDARSWWDVHGPQHEAILVEDAEERSRLAKLDTQGLEDAGGSSG